MFEFVMTGLYLLVVVYCVYLFGSKSVEKKLEDLREGWSKEVGYHVRTETATLRRKIMELQATELQEVSNPTGVFCLCNVDDEMLEKFDTKQEALEEARRRTEETTSRFSVFQKVGETKIAVEVE